VTDCA